MEDTRLIDLDLSLASPIVIEVLIEDASSPQVFSDILLSNIHRPEIIRLLFASPYTPPDIKNKAREIMNLPALKGENLPSGLAGTDTTTPEQHEEYRRQSLLKKIQGMSVGEKIHAAMLGGRETRTILSKDTNKEVVLTVIKNPKITDGEVEMLARSRNVPDEALRLISKNKEWMKNYSVISALVNNPRTPAGISSALMISIKPKDLVFLEKNKNVPESVRSSAKRLLEVKKRH